MNSNSQGDNRAPRGPRRLQPRIDPARPVLGPRDAPIQIFAYEILPSTESIQGWSAVRQVIDEFPGLVAFRVKHHLTDDSQYIAMMYAQYFEALARLHPGSEWTFRECAQQLYLTRTTKRDLRRALSAHCERNGLSLGTLDTAGQSDEVFEMLTEDQDEVEAFCFGRAPTYVVNGLGFAGVYSVQHFRNIIRMTLQAN